MRPYPELPPEIVRKLERAKRLEWITLGFLVSIIAVMFLVLGSSQAMRSAWIEDLLSLLPPVLFLLSEKIERNTPTERFPYGFHRVGSLGFFAAACALAIMGALLVVNAAETLIAADHPTIGTVSIFGEQVWLGWLMIAALAYSIVPPVILGRMKKSLARELKDKILYTDADMNSADWQTGLAGIAGIIGIGFGLWWADAIAAGIISISVLNDGIRNCRTAIAELIDGAPRAIDSTDLDEKAQQLRRRLEAENPGFEAQIRETGRYMRAMLVPKTATTMPGGQARDLVGDDEWRLLEVGRAENCADGVKPKSG